MTRVLTTVRDWQTNPIWSFLLLALLLVIVAQVIVSFLHWWFSKKIAESVHPTDETKQKERLRKRKEENWSRSSTGITEVLAYYVVFMFTGVYVFAFFIGWLGIKTALGWQRQKVEEGEYLLKASMASLSLNLINLLLAVSAGWFFKQSVMR